MSAHRPSAPAAVAVAVGATFLFVALSFWWLANDRAMPYGDAGFHLTTALEFRDAIASGHWIEPFRWHQDVYPPFTPLVGALGFLLGGRSVAAPILTENLIYVPLLALACYRIARRGYDPLGGCLAVVFALGAPLIAEQFHVLMLDAPLTALVAVTVWLVLESERFQRVPIAALAGVVVGVGLLSKQTFPLYVAGFVVIVLLRDRGWRNVRGLGAFLGCAVLIAAPWYLGHAAQLHRVLLDAGTEINVPPLAKPALLSTANFGWYFWALANGVLFTPLLAFAVVGIVTTGILAVRRRETRDITVELLGGFALALAAITAMPHKDVRYAMPLLVFLAVLGTGWITRLRPTLRALPIVALVLAVAASTMGATFGVGHASSDLLPGNWHAPLGQGVMPRNHFTIYTNHNYMVSGPRRAGDLRGLFSELRDAGVREVRIFAEQAAEEDIDFNPNGLRLFLRLSRLGLPRSTASSSTIATLIHGGSYGAARPCVRLPAGDGGVWVRLGDPAAKGARDFCPRFTPRFYGP